MSSRKTFPEISTMQLLEKAGLKYLHHVYLEDPSSKFKRRSEIDFIVFHPRGLLILESKGGDRYERTTEEKKGKRLDVWTYFEGDSKLYSQSKSPFDQVTENLEDFRRILREKDSKFNKICFARGVVFPDLKFSDAGILQNSPEITFDVESESFSEFIEGCFDAEYTKQEPDNYDQINDETQAFIESLLFPNEPKTFEQPHEFRDYSLSKIKNYLYGPAWDDPSQIKIDVYPGELYSTGILHSLKPIDDPTPVEFEEDDVDESNFSESQDSNISKNHSTAEENTDNEYTNSHSIMRPSSAGIYFSIPQEASVEITYGYSLFSKDENNRWTRIHFTDKEVVKLNQKRFQPKKTKNDFVTIEIRSHFRDSIQHVGIYLVNRSDDENIYQVGLKAKLLDCNLIPQEPIFDDLSDGNLFDAIKIYGSGKGVAVNWNSELNEIWTDFIPEYDVAKIESKSNNDSNLSIYYLADPESNLSQSEYINNLNIFVDSYSNHLADLVKNSLLDHQKENINRANEFCKRIKKGIHYLSEDQNAFDAFKLMNLSILTMFARKSKYQGENFYDTDPNEREPSWYAFQFAFCLAAIPGIIDPVSEKDDREIVDLIWFPTGGGKTESYLALLSFTILLRRLNNPQNVGTTIIMRYTLRLLVQDQFSRLASLTVAMDYIRKEKFLDHDLGDEQITLGYWVGRKASPKSIQEANAKVKQAIRNKANQLPFVLDRCPWCDEDLVSLLGSPTAYASFSLDNHNGKPVCTNQDCGYSATDKSGLPVILWEDEILKNPPTIIIGTVDNFAKLAWHKYDTQNLFGTTRNGYDCSPPDLIIQDELHLISGPLGSLVGLYDQLLRTLCSKEHPVKIAVSTATISNADQQISRLYGNRSHQVVPPPEIQWGDSFFMSTNEDPKVSRKYLGVFNGSLSPVVSSINTASALLQSSAFRPDISKADDESIDPYKTLVWYFNSIRELAYSISSRWNIESRVNFLANSVDKYLGKKFRRRFEYANLQELTSRKTAPEIKNIKENLTTAYKQEYEKGDKRSVDVLFATNMISVGVDIPRLGLMMVNGLPKTSSEYIQASSRVGRKHPGLVITSYNINKSRDRSHYEYFRSMHEGLYRYVEPTSVTPFSAGARKKGLAGVFFAYLMHIHPTEDPTDFSPDEMNEAKKWIIDIVTQVHPEENIGVIDSEINQVIKAYKDNQDHITEWGNMVGNDDSTITSLMGTFSDSKKKSKRHVFDILTSLRNVDRDVSVRIFQED